MGFSEALNSQRVRKGPACIVCTALDEMDKQDAADLANALQTHPRQIPDVFIMRALRSVGFKVGAQAVGKHRRGECNGLR
jgi:hypothetical protein